MRTILAGCSLIAAVLVGCGRNEPGTMGGEPGVPETVATGAPAQAAKETSTTDPNQPALASEQASSSYDDPATTNATSTTRPDASTAQSPEARAQENPLKVE